MGWNPVKEAERKAKQVIDKVINPAERAAEQAIWKLRKETWATIERKGKSTIDDIEDHVEGAYKKAEHKLHDVAEELEDKIPELIEKALDELAEAVTKEGLKKVRSVVSTADTELTKLANNKPELVGAINSLGGYIEIGPVTLSYSDFYTRTSQVASVLDVYINNPPEFRRKPILDMIQALGPTSVNLGLSIQVMALVVGSKELGVGGGLSDIPLVLFTELGDILLEKMGVPE